MSRELLKQALSALELMVDYTVGVDQISAVNDARETITAIRAHLDNTKDAEPVAWSVESPRDARMDFGFYKTKTYTVPLYLTQTIPAGYVLVPEEPTDEMLAAAIYGGGKYSGIYKSMLAAAKKGE